MTSNSPSLYGFPVRSGINTSQSTLSDPSFTDFFQPLEARAHDFPRSGKILSKHRKNKSNPVVFSLHPFLPARLRLTDEIGFLFRSEQRGFAVVRGIGVPNDFREDVRTAVVDFDFTFVEVEQVVYPEGVLFAVVADIPWAQIGEDHARFALNEDEVIFFKMGCGASQGVPFSGREQEDDIDRGDPVAAGFVCEYIVGLSVLIEVGLIGAAIEHPSAHEAFREDDFPRAGQLNRQPFKLFEEQSDLGLRIGNAVESGFFGLFGEFQLAERYSRRAFRWGIRAVSDRSGLRDGLDQDEGDKVFWVHIKAPFGRITFICSPFQAPLRDPQTA